jgi:S-adenosylmethionine decarboxylase
MSHHSSVKLGIDLEELPSVTQAEIVRFPSAESCDEAGEVQADHFVVRNGKCYAGTHLIIDLWEAEHLDNLEQVERALREAVEAAGATLLHIHLHHFTPNGGVSGVAVLAESHISIHTWPERSYAALDVFMCGNAEPRKTVPVLERAFKPKRVSLGEHLRGEIQE